MTGSTTAATTTPTRTLSMKLLVDTKARRVLFAEAGKDGVDFLFSLLALPIGTAVKLLGAGSMVGAAGNLYDSVEKLDDTHVQPGAAKGALLRPAMAPSPADDSNSALLGLPVWTPPSKRFYRCSHNSYSTCRNYVTDTYGTKCPGCSNAMTSEANFAPAASAQAGPQLPQNGFVRGVVTYTVMDSLAVSPMSAISSITLLNTFAVTDLSALQEKAVQIGYKEGLENLKASLQSKTVLTDVFLCKKKEEVL
ncbi:uncharacterized protein LOC100827825 [Brachypodium distachyon]|uniref:DUF674 domain-containing protein n=1 Tax=Brachypodium distachyon TaxID=15368 RepID=I1GPK0_BRADI|nr:uncharacterized protein LOC100827825 [Brachypodium distachyon]KQK13775.1 hypothetical protein BRADI_1g12420v3 [Brachypodium distachyon]|eukprot:XP_003559576.1 uncharacterized protein LOC100827825 [Brachypodium distachyon]